MHILIASESYLNWQRDAQASYRSEEHGETENISKKIKIEKTELKKQRAIGSKAK